MVSPPAETPNVPQGGTRRPRSERAIWSGVLNDCRNVGSILTVGLGLSRLDIGGAYVQPGASLKVLRNACGAEPVAFRNARAKFAGVE
jgi:hypothetical protein